MSTRTVIIWLAVAILLGGAAFLVLRGTGGGTGGGSGVAGGGRGGDTALAPGELVLKLDPASVRAMTVRTPDNRVQHVERAAAAGEWNLVVTDAAGAQTTWPLVPARMRSILTLMSTLRAEGPATASAVLGESPTVVTLALDDGSTQTLRLAERTLGGTGLIEYQTPEATRRAMVADSFLNVFRNPGPRAWRDPSALPGVGPDASRIRLENDDRVIQLVRAGGRWNIAEPVRAPASATKVTQVISALERLLITDFLDERRPDAAVTRLDRPAARVRVETDQRQIAPEHAAAAPTVVTRVQQLAVGGPADSTGRNLFAAVGPAESPRTVAIDAAALATVLTTDPAAYIAPQATPVVPADVGAVSLSTDAAIVLDGTMPPSPRRGERRFKRSLGAWADVLADGRESQLADGDVNAVTELLTFLGTRAAQSVHIAPPDGYTPAGAVVLASPAGSPLDAVEVGTLPSSMLVLRSGDVYRAYSAEATPRMLRDWLGAAGVRLGQPIATPIGPDTDLGK